MKPLLAVLLAGLLGLPGITSAQQPLKKPTSKELLNADLFLAITHNDPAAVRAAVAAGADPNNRNWLTVTPLIWAGMVGDLQSAKFLVSKGARINDDTLYGSALTQALLSGQDAVAVYLLEKGAKPRDTRFDRTTPLMISAGNGSMGAFRRLLKRTKRADLDHRNDDGATALTFAARGNRIEAVKLLLEAGARVSTTDSLKRTPLHYAAQDGFADVVKLLIAKRASVKAVDSTGAMPLHLAARYSGDGITIRHLLTAGADPNARDRHGKTPYELAARRGFAAASILKTATRVPVSLTPEAAAAPSDPIALASAAIQKSMRDFAPKAPCISCHHEGLGLMTLGQLARRNMSGVKVDPKVIGTYMGRLEEDGKKGGELMHAAAADPKLAKLIPAVDIGDFSYGAGYFLNAARANGVPPNPGFAEVAVVLGGLQRPDGSWRFGFPRGTMQHSNVTTTAMVLEALNTYWPADRKDDLEGRKARAKAFVSRTAPRCAEDMAAKAWALKAAGAEQSEIDDAVRAIRAAQRPDGGWRAPNAPRSDAYTTGLSLYVLRTVGGTAINSDVVERAAGFLIRTQDEDGTWYVPKATGAYNNHFDAAFPHGYSQYASFAGTCWAVLGLMETSTK